MEIGMVQKVDIDREMRQSYLDYAMSVIVARALPDARDGLKPVQRRILYAMYDMGLRPDTAFKKSARIVGEVLGKYHPHGDQAVYEAMARMAQEFSLRNPLVAGQGNFGSVDGDPPAAMRYTEARLTPYAMTLLSQIDKDTVDFVRNFDESLNEPEVLPAALPNLLVNGASGIAVGMATNIPPYNLGEVIDALVVMLRGWDKLDDINVTDLMKCIKGPDFPTGGVLLYDIDQGELLSAYATGKGKVTVRGRAHFEETTRGRSRIIITELPYQVNKSSLIERIAEIVREGGLDGIADLRDESDRQGMRIVIELSKSAGGEDILRELYKRTQLQTTFGITLLALVDNQPRLLTLKQALRVYLDHRQVVVKRRSEYDLKKAKDRLHILEALRIALKNLDEIIALIRGSEDGEKAKTRLMSRYHLSEIQAQAILDMPLKRLASLERKKIEEEYKQTTALIKELESLLKSPKRIREVIETELLEMKQLFADKRRTQIVGLKEGEAASDRLTTTDLVDEITCWVGLTEDGKIGRTSGDDLPRISGREAPYRLLRTTTHHVLYLIGDGGKSAAIPVHALPEVEKFDGGIPVEKAAPFPDDQSPVALVSVPDKAVFTETHSIVTVTAAGMIKKSLLADLPGASAQAFVLSKVNSGDRLGWAFLTSGDAEYFLVTKNGMSIRFTDSDIRPMGLGAAGVNGIKLSVGDEVVAAIRLNGGGEILAAASNGQAWRIGLDQFPVQGRYGQGTGLCKLPHGVQLVGVLYGKPNQIGIVQLFKAAAKTIRLDEVPTSKRLSAGKTLIEVKAGDSVIELIPVLDGLNFWNVKPVATRKPRTLKGLGEKPSTKAVKQTRVTAKKTKSGSEKPVVKAKKKPAAEKGQAAGKK